jgi:hypothetical protein
MMQKEIMRIVLRPLSGLQLSQLFLNCKKLEDLQPRIDLKRLENIPPISLKHEWIKADGRTRVDAACLAGQNQVPAVKDEDDLDWEAYRVCVGWRQKARIDQNSDLQGRVIESGAYKKVWLSRCKRMQDRMEAKRC